MSDPANALRDEALKYTESALGNGFAETLGKSFRHRANGLWVIRDDQGWKADRDGTMLRMALGYCAKVAATAPGKHAVRLGRLSTARAVLAIAATAAGIAAGQYEVL